jgi:hypothetical protein
VIVRNVNLDDLDWALATVNGLFNNNVRWRRSPEWLNNSRGKGSSYRCTLTVWDSGEEGGRRSASGRRVAAACWHIYGAFFDALPGHAVISANGVNHRPGDTWEDRNIGGQWAPFYYSDACECGSSWRPSHGAVCNS